MQNWTKKMNYYQLSDKYSIIKADSQEFSIYESVYGDGIYNRFAVKHWDLRLEVSLDNPFASHDSFYWIKIGDRRVGGVLIEPNVLARLFLIPPFTNLYEIIKLLKKLLIQWSDINKNIYAYQIPTEQGRYFEMLGFWMEKNRRWMMRPTEYLEFNWDENVIIKNPKSSNNIEIAKLFYESFKDGVDLKNDVRQKRNGCSYEDYLDEVNDYFNNTDDMLVEASTLVYDKEVGKLIGVCLVSMLEEWPLIHTIGVHPLYKGRKLGAKMLKKAITALNKNYPILRLFVTIGNVAESIYYDLGFIQGVEFKKYYLPTSKQ